VIVRFFEFPVRFILMSAIPALEHNKELIKFLFLSPFLASSCGTQTS
jgi:hypothetical protein